MKKYSAKILLFGEHIVLNGALSLAIPFSKYYAHWDSNRKDAGLEDFYDFCEELPFVDAGKLAELRSKHQQLRSNIPIGYGLGSSGSLCAAVYEYLFPNQNSLDNRKAIEHLAEMECFFHGRSSGMDAFTIYKNKAIVYSQEELRVLDNLEHPFLNDLYIIDSGVSRSSKNLISKYLKNKSNIPREIVVINNDIVSKLTKPYEAEIGDDMKKLSSIQLDIFDQMILPSMREIWNKGLKSDEFYMKLCGAGGGGFYLAWGSAKSISDLPFKTIKVF